MEEGKKTKLLELSHLSKSFYGGVCGSIAAVKDVSLSVRQGESLGIVGESGCGKSTLARMITGLTPPSSGEIFLDGQDITHLKRNQRRQIYRKVQMVFQNPYSAFSPRMEIGTFLEEGMVFHGMMDRAAAGREAVKLMEQVELSADLLHRLPHQLSGGQLQRVVIARAISIRPKLLILDEATSALDVSVQKQILMLLARLQREQNLTYLFIGHDLAVVRSITDRIAVMRAGEVVETLDSEHLSEAARHPYTKTLLASVFSVGRR